MAVAAVNRSGAKAPAGPASKPAGSSPAPKMAQDRSIWHNLAVTNTELGHKIWSDILGVAHHPFKAIGGMLAGMLYPVLHPIASAQRLFSAIKADPLDGGLDAIGTTAGIGILGTILVGVGALIAAPFTAGASIPIALAALGWANALSIVCVASDAGGILLHEVRGARARSDAQAKSEGDSTASYAEDEALNLGLWNLGNWIKGAFPKLPDDIAQTAGNGLGNFGVYDPIPRGHSLFGWRFGGGKPTIHPTTGTPHGGHITPSTPHSQPAAPQRRLNAVR